METSEAAPAAPGWAGALKPYLEKESLAAFFLGVSSGFPYALIGATLTSRLAQDGIDKKTVTAFTLVFLAYNFKFLWAWVIDGVRLPVLGRLGQRVSWMLLTGALVIAAVANLALVDPAANIGWVATSAILVGIAGATFDIVIDAYRIETLRPDQLGVGSGMTQYGWRIGSAGGGGACRVGGCLHRVRCLCAACHAHRAAAGRTGPPPDPRTRQGPQRGVQGGLWTFHRVLSAQGRFSGPAVHPVAQDRRYAGEPHCAPAAR
jgi:PAT family beta-lactamase induction signal transducer AmpG